MPLYIQPKTASDTASGDIELSTQVEMEAATDMVRAVVPGRLHFHLGVAKTWSYVNGSGTPVQQTSYNMTSITDTGVGIITFTIATDFSSTSWSGQVQAATTCAAAATVGCTAIDSDLRTASVIVATCWNMAATNAVMEGVQWSMQGLGDL